MRLKANSRHSDICSMQPEVFHQMRANLASVWSCSKRDGKLRRLSTKSVARNSSLELEESISSDDDDVTMKALKAELEDLCFEVLQPEVFRQMRANLASMWSCSKREGKLRRLSTKSAARNSSLELEESISSDDDDVIMKVVLPFNLMLDRIKRIKFSNASGTCLENQTKPNVVRDAGIALSSMADGPYYRGGRIFTVVVDELLELGMKNALSVLLSGSSAGGLGAMLHFDRFKNRVPPFTKVKCLSDASYFITLNNPPGFVELHAWKLFNCCCGACCYNCHNLFLQVI